MPGRRLELSRRELIVAMLTLILVLIANSAAALDVVIYPPTTSAKDLRRDYGIKLLTRVLQRTEQQYGPYRLESAQLPMVRQRMFEVLKAGKTINITTNPYTRQWVQDLIAIQIPIDLGLQSWRLALIDQKNQARLSASLDSGNFKQLRVGGGHNWVSLGELRGNGFNVVTGSSYEGLFGMLLAGRFDYLPRGLNEIYAEFDQRARDYPALAVESSFVLHDQIPSLFYVSPKAPRLARRISEGMEGMLKDGSLERFMLDHFKVTLRRARLCERRVIELRNPELDPALLARKELWFDPFEPRHGLCSTASVTSWTK